MIALNVDFYYKGTTKKSGGCTCIFNLATNQIYSQHIFRIGNKDSVSDEMWNMVTFPLLFLSYGI